MSCGGAGLVFGLVGLTLLGETVQLYSSQFRDP